MSGCSSGGSVEDFPSWILQNGGDETFLNILEEFGFKSRLSLSNLNVEEDGRELIDRLNCGQQCLLRGLIHLAGKATFASSCERSVEKVQKKTQQPAMRAKLNKLFNFKSPAGCRESDQNEDSEDFLPQPSFRHQPPSKSRKSGAGGKGKATPGKPLPLKKVCIDSVGW